MEGKQCAYSASFWVVRTSFWFGSTGQWGVRVPIWQLLAFTLQVGLDCSEIDDTRVLVQWVADCYLQMIPLWGDWGRSESDARVCVRSALAVQTEAS